MRANDRDMGPIRRPRSPARVAARPASAAASPPLSGLPGLLAGTPESLLQLQQLYGNRYVAQMLAKAKQALAGGADEADTGRDARDADEGDDAPAGDAPPGATTPRLQAAPHPAQPRPKVHHSALAVSQPGDPSEREADWVAEQVMLMPEPGQLEAESFLAPPIESLAGRVGLLAQRQVDEEEEGGEGLEEEPKLDAVEGEAEPEEEGEGEAGDLELEEEGEEEVGAEPGEEEEAAGGGEEATGQGSESVRAEAEPGRRSMVSPALRAQIAALRGGGEPLAESTRSFFEPRFGYDLGGVRVHTGAEAAGVARALRARAFTVGQDVAFGMGQYGPGTSEGNRLLAHELTHVLQQSRGLSGPAFPIASRVPTAPERREWPRAPVATSEQAAFAVMRQMEKATPSGGAEPVEAETTFKLGLYDYNIEHMKRSFTKEKREGQRRYFQDMAKTWGKRSGVEVYKVQNRQGAQAKLEQEIRTNAPAKLQWLALFGHGGSTGGWLNMGDVGGMLLGKKVQKGLVKDLHVLLYMCSTGSDWKLVKAKVRKKDAKGQYVKVKGGFQYEYQKAKGKYKWVSEDLNSPGEKSYASKLAGRLKEAGFSPEVWAHFKAGDVVYNPHWVMYKDEEQGTRFARVVFDAAFVGKEEQRLAAKYGGKTKQAGQADKLARVLGLTGGLLPGLAKPDSVRQVMERWYLLAGAQKAKGQAGTGTKDTLKAIMAVPVTLQDSVKALRTEWQTYIDAGLQAKQPIEEATEES